MAANNDRNQDSSGDEIMGEASPFEPPSPSPTPPLQTATSKPDPAASAVPAPTLSEHQQRVQAAHQALKMALAEIESLQKKLEEKGLHGEEAVEWWGKEPRGSDLRAMGWSVVAHCNALATEMGELAKMVGKEGVRGWDEWPEDEEEAGNGSEGDDEREAGKGDDEEHELDESELYRKQCYGKE